MTAKDYLDYGALGVATFFIFATVGGAFAFTKWVMTQAFEVMKGANQSYAEIARIAREIQDGTTTQEPVQPVPGAEGGSESPPPGTSQTEPS